MKTDKNLILVTILAFLLSSYTIFGYYAQLDIADTIECVITSVGIAAVYYQMKKARELSTGQFALSLHEEYATNGDYADLFIRCWDDLTHDKSSNINLENDSKNILNYLTFFESLYVMVVNRVLDIEILDEFFGRRFFVVINNRSIQELDLVKNYSYYINVFKLHSLWKEYRIANNREIFAHDINITRIDRFDKNKKVLKDLQFALIEKIKYEYDILKITNTTFKNAYNDLEITYNSIASTEKDLSKAYDTFKNRLESMSLEKQEPSFQKLCESYLEIY